ncbi:hypothetical protein B9Z45_14785 [Limnohabitans sp. 2KL-17]|uniref:hypothetical protein n=1 Tax=Limnohabitans sp. 2KL-17 TaxID=1100704 RepID=UPI000D34ED13|nr:hypothetical protein [Limnohabitans sp. 2KL-17]PUE51395.1 hypothetical protein B9Z45_14785 [Limnohabitans sp. 2KL-17]
MGLQVGQGEQKTKGISECERKIKKIKTMRGEIALANGVFQQPAKPPKFGNAIFAKCDACSKFGIRQVITGYVPPPSMCLLALAARCA